MLTKEQPGINCQGIKQGWELQDFSLLDGGLRKEPQAEGWRLDVPNR